MTPHVARLSRAVARAETTAAVGSWSARASTRPAHALARRLLALEGSPPTLRVLPTSLCTCASSSSRCAAHGVPARAMASRSGPGEEQTEVEKNPLDYPAEWSVPPPSKRPDIWPEFEPMETPLPNPMPGDPEQPNEAEEEETKPHPEVDPDDPMNPEEDEEEEEEGEDGKKEGIPDE